MGQSFGSVNISVTLFFTGRVVTTGSGYTAYDALGKIYSATINSVASKNNTPTTTQPSLSFRISYAYDECGKAFLKGSDSNQPIESLDSFKERLAVYRNTPERSITSIELEIDGEKTFVHNAEQLIEEVAKILPRIEYSAQKPRDYSRTEMMQYHAKAAYSLSVAEASTRMQSHKLNAEQRLEPYTTPVKQTLTSITEKTTSGLHIVQQYGAQKKLEAEHRQEAYTTAVKQAVQFSAQKATECLNIMSVCKEITQQHLEDYTQKAKATLEPVIQAAAPAINFMYQHQAEIEVGLIAVAVAAVSNQMIDGECPAPRYIP